MMNNVTLIGRPTKDPDLRYTASGTAVATFTLAVNRNYTNQNGDRETDFINCVIWRKPAETLANYVRKGTLIGISGRLQTRNYENQQGQRVYVTEVIVENFYLLESRSQAEAREQKQKTTQNSTTNNQFSSTASNVDNNDPFNGNPIDISDDDLPF
ncbi:single-stranded DNA-binding protein [Enterococcus faecalis]|jgi:single-strand DNA-binding protein|uniref:Single-stranded DNA-binding protein n=2 Tax=Enterococcus faecalis TaxID=1351 RepID=A0ABD7IUB8_ENTFL|nr:single-stranded DNA-binding protein [Enterococcus faecalis]EGO2699513.1 single-stranded DNA-binding protein [Enterococcus faecalis]EGO2744046.1 single-stranded DNA-binding protein [Enterococcus faecalis]EGO5042206.1 single-stranded DNA-binding protein [Enterococcus faecalis]EGO5115526.1 single-stranded DNA-binding protein [Enterococcus faecalis]EGO5154720.1 single-stranded DNA-binding protein [Enterococcus faecalis]